jgi:hypothetical protein
MAFRAAFFKGTHPGFIGLFNRFIRFWTRGKYSHMAIIFSDDLTGTSTFKGGGVTLALLTYVDTDWDYLPLPEYLEEDSRKWFEEHKGNAYDWNAVVRFGLGFIPEPENKYDCSSSCLSSLKYNEAFRFDPNSSHSVVSMIK